MNGQTDGQAATLNATPYREGRTVYNLTGLQVISSIRN